jgi:ribosomal protein S21
MAYVTRKKGESVEQMIRRFNKKVEKEGIRREEEAHRHYQKKKKK